MAETQVPGRRGREAADDAGRSAVGLHHPAEGNCGHAGGPVQDATEVGRTPSDR
jgi:hypothetical protein